MRGNEVHGSTNPGNAWQAIRAICATAVFRFLVILLLALGLLLASPLATS